MNQTSNPQEPLKTNGAARQPLPGGVALLAVFFAAFGALGVLFTLGGMVFDLMGTEQKVGDVIEEMKRNVPPEMRPQFEQMLKDEAMANMIRDTLDGVENIIPHRAFYTFASFMFSLVSLIAGVGMLMRKEWARVLAIWFLISATVFTFAAGFTMLPGLIEFNQGIQERLQISTPFNVGRMLYIGWSVMALTFGLLHAGIVYGLTRPKVKAAFFS